MPRTGGQEPGCWRVVVEVGESPSFVMIVNSLLALPSAGRTTGPRRPRLAAGGGIVLLLTCTGATLELGALGECLHPCIMCIVADIGKNLPTQP